jgi:hypothetical protein
METLKTKIEDVINKVLPQGFYVNVVRRKEFFSANDCLNIHIATSNKCINRVQGQYPDHVSLYLDSKLELKVQMYGCSGGNRVLVKPNLDDPREKYMAFGARKVSFRKPKNTEESVLKAIETFATKYLEILKTEYVAGNLCYDELSDYANLLK